MTSPFSTGRPRISSYQARAFVDFVYLSGRLSAR